jgi:hypothetical protein
MGSAKDPLISPRDAPRSNGDARGFSSPPFCTKHLGNCALDKAAAIPTLVVKYFPGFADRFVMACVECGKLLSAHARALRVHGLAIVALDARKRARAGPDIVTLQDAVNEAWLDSEIAQGKLELHRKSGCSSGTGTGENLWNRPHCRFKQH